MKQEQSNLEEEIFVYFCNLLRLGNGSALLAQMT